MIFTIDDIDGSADTELSIRSLPYTVARSNLPFVLATTHRTASLTLPEMPLLSA
jgi:hypothetical protein